MPPHTSRRSSWQAIRRQWRRLYVRVVRAPGDPRDIALGMAIGVIFSLIPVAQTLLAVGAAGVVRRVTKRRVSYLAAAAGTWFTNPLTFGPVYALTTLVGRPIAHALLELTGLGSAVPGTWFSGPAVLETSLGVLVGAAVVGPPLAILCYEITRRLVEGYQRRRIARQRARALRAIGAEAVLAEVETRHAAGG